MRNFIVRVLRAVLARLEKPSEPPEPTPELVSVLIFNYPQGNDAARLAQEKAAKKITKGVAITRARSAVGNWPAVEQISVDRRLLSRFLYIASLYWGHNA